MQLPTKLILCALAASLSLLPGCGATAVAVPASASASSGASESSEPAPVEASASVGDTASSSATATMITGQITAIEGSVVTVQPGTAVRPDGEKRPAGDGKEGQDRPEGREKPAGNPSGAETPDAQSSGTETPPDKAPRDDGEAPGNGETSSNDKTPPSGEAPGSGKSIPFTADGDPVQYTLTDATTILLESRGGTDEAGTAADLSVGAIVSIQPGSNGEAATLTVKRMGGGTDNSGGQVPESRLEITSQSA